MADTRQVQSILGETAADARRSWSAVVLFELGFQLARVWLMVPLVGLLLRLVMWQAGYVAITDRDIIDFVFSPLGALYAVLLACLSLTAILLEQAGVIAIATLAEQKTNFTAHELAGRLLGAAWPLLRLSLLLVAAIAICLAPFLLLAWAVYKTLLSGHDIYFYWQTQPPVFWIAVALGSVLVLFATLLVATLLTRRSLALPITLLEHTTARAALRRSVERLRGAWRAAFALFAGYLVVTTALTSLLMFGFQLAMRWSGLVNTNSLWTLGLLLAAEASLLTLGGRLTTIGLALITRRLYLLCSPAQSTGFDAALPSAASRSSKRLAVVLLAMTLLSPVAIIWALPARLGDGTGEVAITAHRGHARAAPENTLAAIHAAIESGADYVEIDVHFTSDNVPVLLHDRDLRRVAGDSRRLDQVTLAEAQRLDVGSWFSPQFAGERIPSLREAIAVCRGKIRMNIELKVFGSATAAGEALAKLIVDERFTDQCVVTSFSGEALAAARQTAPRVEVGLIISTAIGEISRLEVNALSVRADMISSRLVRQAHARGMQVFAWTVNDAGRMMQLMKRGVDNLITSDPDLAVRTRGQWRLMSRDEQLLTGARLLLGIQPDSDE